MKTKKLISSIILMLLAFPAFALAEPLQAKLVFTYALFSNVPLRVRDDGPPLRQSGVRLAIHKPIWVGLFIDLEPYLWNAPEDRIGNGGAVFRLGWQGETFGVNLEHESQHNFDSPSIGGHYEWDAINVIWVFN